MREDTNLPKGKDPYFSTTFEKGLSILSLFDRDNPSRSLSELTKITGINKTSVYRFVNTLVTLGYLRKGENNHLLSLGPKAFVLGHRLFHGFDILQSAKPIIDKTFLEHRITIDCALFHENTLISIYRRETENLISLRLPLIMTDLNARSMGKAVLAQMSSDELNHFLDKLDLRKLTPKTIVDHKTLRKVLSQSLDRGYSINNEEYVKGIISIGAAILNYKMNKVVGAVSLDFPTSEYTLETIEKKYTGILTKLARELSEIFTVANA